MLWVKKMLATLLSACLLFSLSACTEPVDSTGTGVSSNGTVPASSTPERFVEYPSSGQTPDFGSTSTVSQIVSMIGSSAGKTGTSSSGAASGNTASVSSAGNQSPAGNAYQPVAYGETKAIWISYLELATLLKGKTQAEFEKNMGTVYQNVKDLGLNTVIVQVRPYSDALYPSEYYPWSAYASGTVGQKPSFDPLKILVDLAHQKGLSFHAWINPLRGMTEAETAKVPARYQTRKWHDERSKSDRLVYHGTRWFLNPAYSEVRKLIADGAAEIVSNYNVDGIHIDDYFYPTTDASFDQISYDLYGKGKTRSQFRLDNCSLMVKEMYQAVKKVNSKVLFGVSPQGNVDNNYSSQFADVKLWCAQKGYLDYIMPQVYFGFENEGQPYTKTVQQWNSMVKADGVQLMIGLACHKIGMENDTFAGSGSAEWSKSTDMLKRQVMEARKLSCYKGIALFDYKSLFDVNSGSILNKDCVKKEVENLKGLL